MTKKRSEEEVALLQQEAAEMYNGDMPVDAIAEELGLSEAYIYRLLSRAGVAVERKRGRQSVLDDLTDEQKDLLVETYLDPETPVSALLQTYGVTYNALYALLRRRGVDVTSRMQENVDSRKARMDMAIEMYERGAMLKEILDVTGIWQPQLHAELHRRGVELRRTPKKVNLPVTWVDKGAADPTP